MIVIFVSFSKQFPSIFFLKALDRSTRGTKEMEYKLIRLKLRAEVHVILVFQSICFFLDFFMGSVGTEAREARRKWSIAK